MYSCYTLYMPISTEDDKNERYEAEFPKGRAYSLNGDRKYFYENGEKVLCEYDAEEDGWFEVIQ